MFGITALIYLLGAVVLFIFTSADVQDWAARKKTHEEVPLNEEKDDLNA